MKVILGLSMSFHFLRFLLFPPGEDVEVDWGRIDDIISGESTIVGGNLFYDDSMEGFVAQNVTAGNSASFNSNDENAVNPSKNVSLPAPPVEGAGVTWSSLMRSRRELNHEGLFLNKRSSVMTKSAIQRKRMFGRRRHVKAREKHRRLQSRNRLRRKRRFTDYDRFIVASGG